MSSCQALWRSNHQPCGFTCHLSPQPPLSTYHHFYSYEFCKTNSRLSKMSELQPLMYAELLANIRQVSVIVSLDTPCDANTSVDLSPQRDSITILHDRKTSTLPLPGQVAPNAMLQKPLQGSRDLSWRLPLAGEPTRGDADLNDSPWAANTLRKDTQFLCRSCDAGIVEEGSVVTWKDLPSENWAEMMDFWHCHKPTEHESHAGHSDEETATANKGYAANSKFTAQNKVGFVDLTTFLLDAKDCNNIRVSLCLYFPIILLFFPFHFFGNTWVSRRWLSPAIATRWHGHRYKHPIATPCPIRFGDGWLSLPLHLYF